MFCSELFLLKTLNLMFFPCLVSKSSSFEIFKNGYVSSENLILYKAAGPFCKNLYVCVLILLHLTCTQMLKLSH